MSAWRRALALVVTQAAFLALPGVPCVAMVAERAPSHCASSCHSRRLAMSCATARCCDTRPAEAPTPARRADDLVMPPSGVRTSPADVAFAIQVPAQDTHLNVVFRAPLVLRL